MRQVARRLRDGSLELVQVPDPLPGSNEVAVRVEASVLSAGTERAGLDLARKSLLAKARARPDQVRQVVERARTDGLRSTVHQVRHRLDRLEPVGYSAAGEILAVGSGVRGLAPGQRVAVGGAGKASHAEVNVVPQLLCAAVPPKVAVDEAAFATLGAIALHGFRRAEVAVGATVAVVGLGLIGQLAVRVARSAGCRVLATDLSPSAVVLAAEAGAEASVREDVGEPWNGRADAVLLCASAPESDDPVRLAATLARDRAPVVIVGDVELRVPRRAYYERELDLRISRSYGPGRYDRSYEEKGHDYPRGYVRWTQQRNMEAFLWLVGERRVQPRELITHRYQLADYDRAFSLLTDGSQSDKTPVAIVLDYPNDEGDDADTGLVPSNSHTSPKDVDVPPSAAAGWRRRSGGPPRFGVVGAGSFAAGTIIPGLIAAGLVPAAVASARGLSATDVGRRFGFGAVHSGGAEMFKSDDLDLAVIATQHDSHAELTVAALRVGLPTYVEKPLAITLEQLAAIRDAQRRSGAPLFVGFNRRYSPIAHALRERLGFPRLMSYRVNAGKLPAAHWVNDPIAGGGRLLGEACHFVDFLCDQAGADPACVSASGFCSEPGLPRIATDNFSLRLEFQNGSVGTIDYAADSPPRAGKERIQISAPGAFASVDDFRTGEIWNNGRREQIGGRRRNKGIREQYKMIADVLGGRIDAPAPEPFYIATLATLAAGRSLRSGTREVVFDAAFHPRSEESATVDESRAT
jgi:predicted dehydrogenase/threonine dehydrogenase-like Zn-dependent dehydrogenase